MVTDGHQVSPSSLSLEGAFERRKKHPGFVSKADLEEFAIRSDDDPLHPRFRDGTFLRLRTALLAPSSLFSG